MVGWPASCFLRSRRQEKAAVVVHDGATCAFCASEHNVSRPVDIVVPYSFKLLMQEISALCIDWQAPLVVRENVF